MTRAEDEDDLARHEREIERHESFNYAVLDEDETALLGCVYVDPPGVEEAPGVDAVVSWRVVDAAVGTELNTTLGYVIPAWLEDAWPFRDVRYGV
jgi:hypothetical protein